MTDYNETFLGDLSDNHSDPTAHEFYPGELVLFTGSNTVTGKSKGGGNPPGDRDYFTFEVPEGFTVSAITLEDYQWGNGNQSTPGYGRSYFAVIGGNSFPDPGPPDPPQQEVDKFLVSKLIDDVTGASEVGQDLLESSVGTAVGPAGPGQLGAGVYSVWYQETGADTTYEFNIKLDAPPGADFGEIQFSSSNIQVNEADGTFDVTLTRTGGSDGGVSAVLRRTGGTAENLVDFSFQPVTALFKDGETQRTFTYPIANDSLIEGDETATFELTSLAGGASLGTIGTSTLTIVDDDDIIANPGEIQFDSSDIQVNEAAGTVDLILNRTGGSDGAVSVDLNQTGGSAQNTLDYNFTPLTVNFADGETQQAVSVAILNDTLVEGNETATFELSSPTGGASLGPNTQTTLTINDNDDPVLDYGQIQFSSSNIQVNEAAGTVNLTLNRTGGSDGAVSVALDQTGGSAQNSLDYNFTPLTVNFAAGETQQIVSVAILNDTLVEGNETAVFELSSPTGGASLGPNTQTTLAISDNDDAVPDYGQIQFSSSNIQVDEAAGTANLTLTRSGGSNGAVSVALNQTGGTAQNSLDYTFAPVTVNFAAGESQRVVSVAILNDTLVEGNETVTFALSNPTGGASLGTAQTSTLTIADNDTSSSGTGKADTLTGGAGDDRISGLRGNDRINGKEGNDELLGGRGNDRLNGNQGNDRLLGGRGNDRLNGGDGDDFLDGGKGEDTLTGGADSDIFVLRRRNGQDLIRDFQIDQDSFDLRGIRFGQLTITQDGTRAAIRAGSDALAMLRGVQADQLTAAQFS